ncbi:hypothetical protein P3W85_13665 [Cupriavidus basilensis]|uniref:DUF6869 domain-containing protein n=1 Tax=Cupriavidus basilensis TaxID=68895 RepID=A0ABT6AN15_9BURK|nr:hypothetical protein [Cupriavidus basilensis]MDF3833993.1 hypothetical protein [Cupriavidus basilensis]
METHEQKRLVNAYIRRYSRYDPAIGRHEVRSFWVWQACDWLCVNDPEGLWQLVLEILERTDSPRVLAALAAGELEDLIEYHGPAFIERIEQQAGRDSRFRRLLCGVWRSSTPQVWARVLAASDSNFNEVPQRAMWICYSLPASEAAKGQLPAAGTGAALPEVAQKMPARIARPPFQASQAPQMPGSQPEAPPRRRGRGGPRRSPEPTRLDP